jgi:hypothetical protein
MSKDRLQEIKQAKHYPATIEEFKIVKIYEEDFEWLISEVERLQAERDDLENSFINENKCSHFHFQKSERLEKAIKTAMPLIDDFSAYYTLQQALETEGEE